MKFIRFIYKNNICQGTLNHDKINIIDGDILDTYQISENIASLDDVKILAPCEPSKIVCIGLNYYDHQLEMNEFTDDFPKIFIKPSTAVIAHDEQILCPSGVDRVDYEAEMAIVIGKTAKNIKKGTAKDYILGYTCMNDVTARNIQKKDGQWTRAKSFDTFAPLGPVISTDVDPYNTKIQLLLNGEIMQNSTTEKLIWDIDFLVEEISKIMTLLPGDIIATGTPSGCGPMKDGDKVEVVIENIGTLANYYTGG